MKPSSVAIAGGAAMSTVAGNMAGNTPWEPSALVGKPVLCVAVRSQCDPAAIWDPSSSRSATAGIDRRDSHTGNKRRQHPKRAQLSRSVALIAILRRNT